MSIAIRHALGAALLALASLAQAQPAAPASAASAPPAEPPGTGTQYSEKGADTCLSCHDPDSDSPGFSTADTSTLTLAHRGKL